MKKLYSITKSKKIAYVNCSNGEFINNGVSLFETLFKEVSTYNKFYDFILNYENNINNFDLIIIDGSDINNINNLISFIKELKIEQKIIMYSAYRNIKFINNLLDLGVDDYLNRPLRKEEIERVFKYNLED